MVQGVPPTVRSNVEDDLTPERRKDIARQCAAKISLRLISPSNLVKDVMESGLVDSDAILQALAKQEKGGAVYVYGAGIPGVNGIYEQQYDLQQRGVGLYAMYEKRGEYDGQDVTFVLTAYPRLRSSTALNWILWAPPAGAGRVTFDEDVDRALYGAIRSLTETCPVFKLRRTIETTRCAAPSAKLRFISRLASIIAAYPMQDTSDVQVQMQDETTPPGGAEPNQQGHVLVQGANQAALNRIRAELAFAVGRGEIGALDAGRREAEEVARLNADNGD